MLLKDALIVTPRTDLPRDRLAVEIGSIGLRGGLIRAVGPFETVRAACPGDEEIIDCQAAGQVRYLAMPGFVDAHTHSRQMALQGYWTSGWRHAPSKPQGAEEASALFRWFLLDAAKAGAAFVCDWPEHPDFWTPAPLDADLRSSGLRGCLRTLLPHNRSQPWPPIGEAERNVRATLATLADSISLGIWIPEEDKPEFSDGLLDQLGELRRRMCDQPLVFQMHLAESKDRKTACPDALAKVRGKGLVDPCGARTVFIHAIWLDDAELGSLIAARDQVGVITCPKFTDGRIAPIKELLDGGVPVGLGSDVAVPDPFELITSLVALHKSRQPHHQLSFAEAFHLATLGGAAVFGLEARIGSLEPGKEADLVLVRTPAAIDPGLVASADDCQRTKLIERLVTRNVIRREHVDTVIVRGRTIVRGGVCGTRQQEAAIETAGRAAAMRIVGRMRM